MMATAERKWFASQPLLSPLLSDGLLTCDALVDKLSSVYARYLRSTWAPLKLIRLNGELKRLLVGGLVWFCLVVLGVLLL